MNLTFLHFRILSKLEYGVYRNYAPRGVLERYALQDLEECGLVMRHQLWKVTLTHKGAREKEKRG